MELYQLFFCYCEEIKYVLKLNSHFYCGSLVSI